MNHRVALAGLLFLFLGCPVPVAGQCLFETHLFQGAFIDWGHTHGTAVAIEGDVALVTRSVVTIEDPSTGVVYVYRRGSDGSWTGDALLSFPPMPSYNAFGESLVVRGDTIFVGDPRGCVITGPGCSHVGAIHVYSFDGSTWNLDQRMTPSEGGNGLGFGRSVAIDGDRMVVGVNGQGQMKVYVLHYDGDQWNEEQILEAPISDPVQLYGRAVDISEDRVIVGGLQASSSTLFTGVVFIYQRDPATGFWDVEEVLTPPDTTEQIRFGSSVALGPNVALIGAERDGTAGDHAGAAYLFEFDDAAWTMSDKWVPDNLQPWDAFGDSVKIDGDNYLVAAPSNWTDSTTGGAVYWYRRMDENWVESRIRPTELADGYAFGSCIDIRDSQVIVGAPGVPSEPGDGFGAAYVFQLEDGFIRGDCNMDAHVDIADGIWLIWELFLQGSHSPCPDACDVDDDGVLTAGDAIQIFQYSIGAGSGAPPAYPFPNPGLDLTSDALHCPSAVVDCP